MIDANPTTEPLAGAARLPSRWRWIWFVATLAIGATGAAVVLAQRDDEPIRPTAQSFDIDNRYDGPVWFTVTSDTVDAIHVTITWGAWRSDFDIGPDDPRTWWMLKKTKGDSPPVSFVVSPSGTVRMGLNTVPKDSRPVPDGSWRQQRPTVAGA